MRHRTVLLVTAMILAGCSRDLRRGQAPTPRTVSFSPAITAMLFEMGLDDHIVGVTTHCTVPEGLDIPVVGSQLNIRAEPIVAVAPDVLLTQTTPARFETVRKLMPDVRIEYVRIETLTDVAETMGRIAALLGQADKGNEAGKQFLAQLDTVRNRVAGRRRPRVIFVMGHRDPSTAGRATFMNELIDVAGGVNVAAEKYDGWKQTGIESVLKLAPDVIVCQCEQADKAGEAKTYWQDLVRSSGSAVAVHVVTDKRWTIPTGWQAHTAAPRLADMIHPETARGAAP